MAEGTLNLEQRGWLDRPIWQAVTLDGYALIWVVLIVLAVVTRFYDAGNRVISHDESLHTYYSWRLAEGNGFVHTPLMHGPFQFHALALTYLIFGDNDFTSRIPAALFGSLAVVAALLFRRWLGKTGAVLLGILILISPYMLYYSRYVRNEAFLMPLTMVFVWAILRYFETRKPFHLYVLTAMLALMFTIKETTFITLAIALVFVGLVYIRDMWLSEWGNGRMKLAFQGLVLVAFVVIGLTLAAEAFGRQLAGFPDVAAVPDPAEYAVLLEAAELRLDTIRQYGAYVIGGMTVLLAVAGLLSFGEFRYNLFRDFASVDLMVLMLVLVLPQLAPLPVEFIFHKKSLTYTLPPEYTVENLMNGVVSLGQILSADAVVTLLTVIVLAVVAVGVGLYWNWQVFLVAMGVFYAIFIPLYTTLFTNGGGIMSGIVGSLGYWIEQHEVQRGSQPWYYYMLVQLPVYEFLPLVGALVAAWVGLGWVYKRYFAPPLEGEAVPETLDTAWGQRNDDGLLLWQKAPLMEFTALWAMGALAAYSIAGEKMPWLTVHITHPMMFLAAATFAPWFERANWRKLFSGMGLATLVVLPLTFVAFASALGMLLGPNRPFQGVELAQLQVSMAFLLALGVAVSGFVALWFLGQQVGVETVTDGMRLVLVVGLAVLTARAAIYASYINYDNQTEFINYASGAPGIRTVMNQIEQLSAQVSDGTGIVVAYDDDVAWPMTWYMRHYYNQVYYGRTPSRAQFDNALVVVAGNDNWARVEPILGDRYFQFEYIRMWWPMQEYWNLTGETGLQRVRNVLIGERAAEFRAAIWDIWFRRDYTAYGDLTGVNYALSSWPVSDRMRFYVRKDVAAQIWDMGVGPSVLAEPLEADPYTNGIVLSANLMLGGVAGSGLGELNGPRNVAVGPNGRIYVADTLNHRIDVFDAEGAFLFAFGAFGSLDTNTADDGRLNEPWGIAVDSEGTVYVADTWNHRVQKFSAEGEWLATWGLFGTNLDNLMNMWGPRGIAVSPDGQLVYVTDTGNKRILVYDSNGIPQRQIGLGGVLPGELDEPVGVAVDGQGNVYVADTWNQRVQVFTPEGGYLREWRVVGWYGQSLENKPYIAVGPDDVVYVSDPEGYRVLAYDLEGNYLYHFGDFGSGPDGFMLPAGVSAGPNGEVYVADTQNQRVMRFSVPGPAQAP